MKIISILFIFFSSLLNINAQTKEYYNQFWSKSIKESALYYTISEYYKDVNLYKVSDYYFNDSLQMQGFYKDKSLQIKHGEFKYYHFNGKLSVIKNFNENLKEGVYKTFNYNGIIEEEGYYLQDKKSGTWKTFYDNGVIKSITVYINNSANYNSFYRNGNTNEIGKLTDDKRTGIWKKFDENKNLLSIGLFQQNLRQKQWLFYFDNGQVSAQIDFNSGAIVNQKYWSKKGDLIIEGKVNYPPIYKDGQTSINEYLKQNCKITGLKGKDIKGTVYFSFVVLPNGNIENLKLIKGVYSALDIQVFNCLLQMQSWTPGKLYNRLVAIEHVIAIDTSIFNLD